MINLNPTISNHLSWYVKIVVTTSITATLVCAIWTYGVAIEHYSTVYAENQSTEVIKQEELSIKEQIAIATNGENVDVIYNLCTKESGTWLKHDKPCQKYAVNENSNHTLDYSWLQINDVHIIGRPASKGKGTITMECVYELACVSRWANEQIKQSNGHIWTAWNKI